MRLPRRIKAGTVVRQPVSQIDFMPTILDWIGGTTPSSVNGRSLMPFIEGQKPDDWRTGTFSEFAFGDPVAPTPWQTELGLSEADAHLAILRKGRFTLVHFNGGLPPLLFDHENAGEMADVAGDPAYVPALLDMTQEMLSHRMRYPDTTLSKIMITAEGPITGT